MATTTTTEKASATPEKPYKVYAHYFDSGNKYLIYQSETVGMARLIANRAEAQLTEPERESFGYIVEREPRREVWPKFGQDWR